MGDDEFIVARFRVHEAFHLQARQWFVLAGEIVEGSITPGMMACVSLNRHTSMRERIAAVEFVDRPAFIEGWTLLRSVS